MSLRICTKVTNRFANPLHSLIEKDYLEREENSYTYLA